MKYIFTVETNDYEDSEELVKSAVKIMEKVKGVVGVMIGAEKAVEEIQEEYALKKKQNMEIIYKISDLLNELAKD